MLSHSGTTSRTSTFILAGGNGRRLDPLTQGKAKPLVPFGGIFRIIDFTLSNCVNSGLKSVHLLTQHKHASFSKYVEEIVSDSGGPFSPKRGAKMTCLSPKPGKPYRGTADALLQNMLILEQERPDFVLILAADHIYKMDYMKLLRCHADSGADVTIAALECPKAMASRFGVLQVNEGNQVIAFEEKPDRPSTLPINSRMALVSMGIYVFSTQALVRAVIEDCFRTNSSHDFGKDLIPNVLGRLRVSAYNFSSAAHETTGYWRDVGTIDSYYRSHMELLLVDSPFDPYNDALWPTYALGGHTSQISSSAELDRDSGVDSVVSRHATISAAKVVQSVISPGVCVEASCEIQSSVLLPGVRVRRGAKIRRAVIDENADIPEGTEIGFDREADRGRFWVTDGGVVVVSANSTFNNQSYPIAR